MSTAPSRRSALRLSLQRYVDARQAALLLARRELGVNELDARALLYIADNPGTRPTQLREYLGITSAGVTTLVDRLVDRSAVRREVDTVDRRVNRISLTIDLAIAPWSALTKFDEDFDVAVAAGDVMDNSRFADALDALLAATAAAA